MVAGRFVFFRKLIQFNVGFSEAAVFRGSIAEAFYRRVLCEEVLH